MVSTYLHVAQWQLTLSALTLFRVTYITCPPGREDTVYAFEQSRCLYPAQSFLRYSHQGPSTQYLL